MSSISYLHLRSLYFRESEDYLFHDEFLPNPGPPIFHG